MHWLKILMETLQINLFSADDPPAVLQLLFQEIKKKRFEIGL